LRLKLYLYLKTKTLKNDNIKIWFENEEEITIVYINEPLNDNSYYYNTLNAFCCYPLLKEVQENKAPTMACKRLVKNNKNQINKL